MRPLLLEGERNGHPQRNFRIWKLRQGPREDIRPQHCINCRHDRRTVPRGARAGRQQETEVEEGRQARYRDAVTTQAYDPNQGYRFLVAYFTHPIMRPLLRKEPQWT